MSQEVEDKKMSGGRFYPPHETANHVSVRTAP